MKLNRFLILLLVTLAAVFKNASCQQNNLEYFLNQGLSHSPALLEINNQLASNTIDSLVIKAGQKPQLGYSGLLYYAPVVKGIGYSEVITNISNITSVVTLSQSIFNQKTIDARYSELDVQNKSLRNSSKLTENELKKLITQQYLNACLVYSNIKFNRDLLSASNQEKDILTQLVERGIYKQVDYLSFILDIKAQEILLKDLQIQYEKEIASLDILCGIPVSPCPELAIPALELKENISPVNSSYYTRFVLDSLKIANEKTLVDRNYKPSVNWFTDAGIVNNHPQEMYKNFGLSAGLSLTVPIYDGRQRKLNYDKLAIAENTRSNYAGYFKQQFCQQQLQLYNELQATGEIIPQVNQQLSLSETVISQMKTLLSKGDISIIDYLTALKNYITVKQNLYQYQFRELQIITELNYRNQ